MQTSAVNSVAGASRVVISGHIHGGQQPVAGGQIQLYAVNSTTDQGASTPLLNTPVTTDANGAFSITGDYTCPASNPLVYLVGTGGNPGLGGSANNSALAMMSLLGPCNNLQSSTYIFVDELTTIVSVYYLAPFMTDYAHIGASATNPVGIGQAYADISAYVNFSTGQFNNVAYTSIPEVTFNSLADILGSCINSAGNTGSSSTCGELFAYTTTNGVAPTDTIGAALSIARSPGNNAAQLFGLIPAQPPFQPSFTSAPTDYTATTGYTLPAIGTIQTAVLASNGHIWLYTAGYNYNTITDTSTNLPGVLTVYDNNFNQLFTVTPGTGGLYYPTYMAADIGGNVWAVNSNNTISKFNASGAALSPSTGWPTPYVSSFSPTGPGNFFQTPTGGVGPIVTDRMSGIHGAAPATATLPCYFDMNSSGTVVTVSGNYCTDVNSSGLEYVVADGVGDLWGASPSAIGKENAANGNLAAFAPSSQGCFYTSGGYSSQTNNLIYDHVNNYVWGSSDLGAGVITNGGVAQFCDYGSTVLPVTPSYTTSATAAPGSAYSAGSLLITNGVLDGAGNFWYVTGGVTATGTVVSNSNSSTSFNGSVTYSTYLNGISPTGGLLTTYNAAGGNYGLQPAGLGTNNTATGSNISVANASGSASLLGVDNSGNIWAYDSLTNKVFKITGLATANTVNY